jgi:hypothetical protein
MTDKGLDGNGDISDIAKEYMRVLREFENKNGDEAGSAANGHH